MTKSVYLTTSASRHLDGLDPNSIEVEAARVIHKGLADGRWAEFSFDEQMAHVGSEVDRTIRAHEMGREDRFNSALARALELFDLTAADKRWWGARRREILRARQEFCRIFLGEDVPEGSVDELREYFLQFAVAARRTPESAASAGETR